MSFSWARAATALQKLVAEDAAKPREDQHLDDGQRSSLAWMAKRLPQSGLVLADEVGTGKTRIACAVVHAVLDAGGRAAVVVPHGLMHQWRAEARNIRSRWSSQSSSIDAGSAAWSAATLSTSSAAACSA